MQSTATQPPYLNAAAFTTHICKLLFQAQRHPVLTILLAASFNTSFLVPTALAQADSSNSSTQTTQTEETPDRTDIKQLWLIIEPVPLSIPEDIVQYDQASVIELKTLPSQNPTTPTIWLQQHPEITPTPNLAAENISRYESLITDMEIEEGVFSPGLPQHLIAQGKALQATGDIEAALEIFARALHIVRVNSGLFSLEQTPVVQASIDAYLAAGNLEGASSQQDYLLYLQQKSLEPQSNDLLLALANFAEWNFYALNADRFSGIDTPFYLQQKPDFLDKPSSMNRLMSYSFTTDLLSRAKRAYDAISTILLTTIGTHDPRLPDTEMRIAQTSYMFAELFPQTQTNFNASSSPLPTISSADDIDYIAIDSNLGIKQGEEALARRVSYIASRNDASADEILSAELDRVDWMLHFNMKRMRALKLYSALETEYAGKLTTEELDKHFNPALPVKLPRFIKSKFSREFLGIPDDVALHYKGYVDIQFSLNRYGRTQDISELGRSEESAIPISNLIINQLRNAQFRPRLANSETKKRDTFQIRYYYSY